MAFFLTDNYILMEFKMKIEKHEQGNYVNYVIEPITKDEEKFIDALIASYEQFNKIYYSDKQFIVDCK